MIECVVCVLPTKCVSSLPRQAQVLVARRELLLFPGSNSA